MKRTGGISILLEIFWQANKISRLVIYGSQQRTIVQTGLVPVRREFVIRYISRLVMVIESMSEKIETLFLHF